MTNNNTDNASFEALPIEVVNSAMSDSQKKVMNVLFTYNTLDKTDETGRFFISNETLREKAGVGSLSTIKEVLSNFKSRGFINREKGSSKNRRASEYILHVDEIMRWSKEHQRMKKCQMKSSVVDIKLLGSVVADAVAPFLAQQQEMAKIINELRDEIKELKSSLTIQSIHTPVKNCITDTEADTDTEKEYKNTYNTCIRQDIANTINSQQTTKASQYDIQLNKLRLAVEEYNRTPTKENKGAVRNIVERIKRIQQQGGCTERQLKFAYYIQGQINSASRKPVTSPVPVTNNNQSVSFSNSSVSSVQPQDELLALAHSSRYYSQNVCDQLFDTLKDRDADTRWRYMDEFLSYSCHNDKLTQSIYKDQIEARFRKHDEEQFNALYL